MEHDARALEVLRLAVDGELPPVGLRDVPQQRRAPRRAPGLFETMGGVDEAPGGKRRFSLDEERFAARLVGVRTADEPEREGDDGESLY